VEVALVATREPRPAGRGSRPTPTAVAEAARRLGLPLLETATVREGDGFDELARAGADVLVVVAYGEILTRDVLDLASPVNLHFSLLPRWRGAAPVQRAILAGDRTTGVTTMLMDEGVDTGPILLQREEPILDTDDAGSLGMRLAGIGGEVLDETLSSLQVISPTPQDDSLATPAPKIAPEERWIDWAEPAAAVVRRVRALAPEPGASARFRGDVLKVLAARAVEGSGRPGSFLAGAVVAAGEGAVELVEVAPAGRRRMLAADWVRGARLGPGEGLA
jgi:methionyl-tRNA formyltransferase